MRIIAGLVGGVVLALGVTLLFGGKPVHAVGQNLVPNASFETSDTGVSPSSWYGSQWGDNTVHFGYQGTGRSGKHSVRTEITQHKSGGANWRYLPVAVVPGRAYKYEQWYQANVATEIDAAIIMQDGSVQYTYLSTALATSEWARVAASLTAPGNAKSVIIYQVLSGRGWMVADDYSLKEYTPGHFDRALVSITFDDSWRSIYTQGLPLLRKYKLPTTQYFLTGRTDWPNYMTVDMMRTFQAEGHEVAAHTVHHEDLVLMPIWQVTNEIRESQNQLRDWFGSGAAKNFASPYGSYNSAVIGEVKKLYRSHRSTDTGFNNPDTFDPYNIHVQNIMDTTTPQQVRQWVAEAQASRTWLVLIYHEVTDRKEDARYAVTPANLDAELNIIKQSGVTVKTVDQALDEIIPQL